MLLATENAIRSLVALDRTIDPDIVPKALDLLKGKTGADDSAGIDVPLTLAEVAQMMKCTKRTVQNYADRGVIRRIGGKETGTITRFSRRSVIAFLEGSAA